jgi:hypothetical protein
VQHDLCRRWPGRPASAESKRSQPAASRQEESAHYGIQMAPGFQ